MRSLDSGGYPPLPGQLDIEEECNKMKDLSNQPNSQTLKTSEAWYKELGSDYMIYDPDGWNRSNYQYSFYEEKITKEEYERRLANSTILPASSFGTWVAQ